MALWPRIKLHHRKKKRKENETSHNSSRSCNITTTEGLSPIQQIVGCFLLLDTSCNLQWRKSWLSCRDHHETKLLLCRSFHDRFPNMSDHVTTKQQIGTGISKWRLYPWWLQEVVATCWAQSLSQTEMAKLHGDPLCMRRHGTTDSGRFGIHRSLNVLKTCWNHPILRGNSDPYLVTLKELGSEFWPHNALEGHLWPIIPFWTPSEACAKTNLSSPGELCLMGRQTNARKWCCSMGL